MGRLPKQNRNRGFPRAVWSVFKNKRPFPSGASTSFNRHLRPSTFVDGKPNSPAVFRVRPIPRSIPNTQYYWPAAIPIPDTDTQYDVISTTHQCHIFISTGQCYSHSHYHCQSNGRTVCDMRRAWRGKVVNGGQTYNMLS